MHRIPLLLISILFTSTGWTDEYGSRPIRPGNVTNAAGEQVLAQTRVGEIGELGRTEVTRSVTPTARPVTPTAHRGAALPWIIDTHTHFKSGAQIELESQTTTWDPRNTLGHVVLPEDYREIAKRNHIQSTMVVEAVDQSQPQFNDWLLEQAKSELICGYVARGDLAADGFHDNYQRYRRSGFLKGYRFRNDELRGYLNNTTALANLKMLERDQMVVDLLVDQSHSSDVIELATKCPQLKIVINHCFRVKMEKSRLSERWKSAVTACAVYPNIFMKLSSILDFAGTEAFSGPAPVDSTVFEDVLDFCFDSFGEDRVVFGTNWGVCTHFGDVDDVVRIVSGFLESKGESAVRKGMRDNAMKLYHISAKQLHE